MFALTTNDINLLQNHLFRLNEILENKKDLPFIESLRITAAALGPKSEFTLENLKLKGYNNNHTNYVNLSGADLREVNARNADASRFNLDSADIKSANFTNANLTEANLRDTDAIFTIFSKANLTKANFSLAALGPTDF